MEPITPPGTRSPDRETSLEERIPAATALSPLVERSCRIIAAIIAVGDLDLQVSCIVQLAASELQDTPAPPPPRPAVQPSSDVRADLSTAIRLLTEAVGEGTGAVEAIAVARAGRHLQAALTYLNLPSTGTGTGTGDADPR